MWNKNFFDLLSYYLQINATFLQNFQPFFPCDAIFFKSGLPNFLLFFPIKLRDIGNRTLYQTKIRKTWYSFVVCIVLSNVNGQYRGSNSTCYAARLTVVTLHGDSVRNIFIFLLVAVCLAGYYSGSSKHFFWTLFERVLNHFVSKYWQNF